MFHPFLAQIDQATKTEAIVWIGGLLAVVVILSFVMQGALATKQLFGPKQPLSATLEKFATQEDLKELENSQRREVDILRGDATARHVDNQRRLCSIEVEQRDGTIHIAELRVQSATLIGSSTLNTTKLDRLIEKLIPPAERR